MDVKDLMALRDKAGAVSGKGVKIEIDGSKFAWLYVSGECLGAYSLAELEARLAELATPPKPATVAIEVPTDWAIWRASDPRNFPIPSQRVTDVVSAACRKAVEQWLPVK